MDIEQAKIMSDKFQSLDYGERLEFWDQNVINFIYEHHTLIGDIIISIRPENVADRISYNKWIVDHWRRQQFQNPPSLRSTNLVIQKSFEDHVNSYKQQVVKKGKEDVWDSEISRISALIVAQNVKRPIVRMVYDSIDKSLEAEIYRFSVDPSSIFLTLRDIARILDLVKYLVFLKQEKRKVEDCKGSKLENFIEMSDKAINGLYHDLIDQGFIKEDTDHEKFVALMKNKTVDPDFYVTWIDRAITNNVGNKLTLMEFISLISPFSKDVEELNAVIIDNFKIQNPDAVESITRLKLKSSWNRIKNLQKVKPDRQRLVLSITKKWTET